LAEAEQPAEQPTAKVAAAAEDAREQPVAEPVAPEPAIGDLDAAWLAVLDVAAAAIPPPPAPLILLGVIPAEELGIVSGLRVPQHDAPAVRYCEWIVDTTGDTIRKCGAPIPDGLARCEQHRFQYAETLLGEPERPPMPFGPFPPRAPWESAA
jgi:hypothetical protein